MDSKLRLHADDLAVESFKTETEPRSSGTVFGEQLTGHTACTCPGCPACAATRDCPAETRAYTCHGCTAYDPTCRNIGTCNPWAGFCADIP